MTDTRTPVSAPAHTDQSQLAPRFRAGGHVSRKPTIIQRAARRMRWIIEDISDAMGSLINRSTKTQSGTRASDIPAISRIHATTHPDKPARRSRTVRLETPIDANNLTADPSRPARIVASLIDQIGPNATITGIIIECQDA